MTHIVLISTSYPDTQSGREAAGSFVADFAEALATEVNVSVVAPSLNAETVQVNANLSVYRFAVPSLPLSLLKPYNPLAWPAIFHTLRAGQTALTQVIEQGQPVDHIFALWVLPSGYWAKRVAQQHAIPYSTWALGSDIWSLGKIPLIKQVLQQVLRASHHNYADGYLLKADVERLSQHPCSFLPSTRQLTLPTLPSLKTTPPYVLAFLGRWHPNKGIDLLLDSLALLSAEDWAKIAEIRIAGGGPLADMVQATCTQLQAQGKPVVLAGYLDKTAAVKWLVTADYALIPSRIESIPVIFSDAMKCQCPVVAMPVGDLPDLLTRYQVGQLATQVTAAGFAQAIQAILNTPPSAFQTALQTAQQPFTLTHSVQQFLANN